MARSSKSKEARIIALLVIDTIFCLIEAITGYTVHSLALVADAFHMLNDIFSLVVALWAVRVARNKGADATYTYGWQRAEILGALINAVFLLALCMTIFIEAVQRFISPEIISNPQLILGVGIAGLVSNFVGLLLFHEHEHGGHSHSHAGGLSAELEDEDEEDSLENHGHSHSHYQDEPGYSDEPDDVNHSHDHVVKKQQQQEQHSHDSHGHSHSHSHSDDGLANESDIEPILPEVFLAQNQGLLTSELDLHTTHKHELQRLERKAQKGNHKSLNMQGVFLHVLGDALGNVGVIVTALLIWKTDYSWRFYFDPAISLFITAIIFSTALPLCRSASKILLQATPSTISADDVQEDVLSLPGVISVHDFHIWNLTEKISIASLHAEINVSPDKFLDVVTSIRTCLHAHGIHSVTVQPEFVEVDPDTTGTTNGGANSTRNKSSNTSQSSRASLNDTYGPVSNCSQNFLPLNSKN